jgi:hypothetical protein
MRQYKHRGCESVMYTYVGYGDGPRCDAPPRSREWLFMGGPIEPFSPMEVKCPDCHQTVNFRKHTQFEATDGKPFFGTWDHPITPKIPTRRSFWQRIKEFFTKGR